VATKEDVSQFERQGTAAVPAPLGLRLGAAPLGGWLGRPYRALLMKTLSSDPGQLLRARALQSCPICGFTGRFWSFGTPLRCNARCPRCFAVERHRLLHLCIHRRVGYDWLKGQRILHFAPERWLGRALGSIPGYVSADPRAANVDIRIDITRMPFVGASFDVLIANHVLEHVSDDRAAMAEILRVIGLHGLAILSVPVTYGYDATFEDPEITAPEMRRHYFGEPDHVRVYGRDIEDRLQDAGLTVETFVATPREEVDYGLGRGQKIYLCRAAR
jgi:SAM-dependent methyltransferase